MRGIEFFTFCKSTFEQFYPKDWFLNPTDTNHKAYIEWDLVQKIISQSGMIRFPEQQADLPLIGKIVLDMFVLSKAY